MSFMSLFGPVLIGVLYAAANSFVPERHRRSFNALMIAGAGAAYLSGGAFGPVELVFTTVMTVVAFRGLGSWRWIGVGWLLHTAWDVAHHLRGEPLLPFAHDSSFGCAICDPVIALWCFAGGPSVRDVARRLQRRRAQVDTGRRRLTATNADRATR
jgi:MFS family permease